MIKKRTILLILLAIFIITTIFLTIHTINSTKAPERRQVDAALYGYKVDGGIILQDTNGQLWEIPYTDKITSADTVRLEVVGYDVEHVWVELVTNPEAGN